MKHFDTFGVMIDCSRNAVPSVSGLKRFFSTISKMGYNMAMLYTEDTYEVTGEPWFGYKRGRYSLAELKELDEYAASVGIELIPCIQTLAHVNALFHFRAYNKIRDIDDILLIDDEKTYDLIDKMFSSLSSAIKSRKIHIGMDEAHNVGRGKYLDRHGLCDRYEILLRHLNRVCEIAKKYGYEPMMWNDMFFRLANGGDYYVDTPLDFSKEITEKVPADCGMVYWDYYSNSAQRYDAMMESTKQLSDNVWFAGGTWVWAGFAPHARYSNIRNALAVPACIRHGVRNAFFTMWGDNGGECPYASALGALMYAAALAEEMSEDEMKAKFKEITGETYDDFIALDLPNYIHGEKRGVGTANYSKNRLYDDPFLGIMTLNGENADGTIYSVYAEKLHKIADESTTIYKTLFASMAALCDVLTIKFSLADRTRTLYANGDKEALRALAENEYTECIKRVETFYTVYRDQWYTMNKTYGFEVQDARLGGLMRRLQSCKDRLLAYANGEIDAIDELCEEVLPILDGNYPIWAATLTANIM
ncbi:MAG: beta-N-acetylhexosaminidase [Clostridia bacterium]|nr:beta-N-acetylhexosaminidase [Clostridia bacterium]